MIQSEKSTRFWKVRLQVLNSPAKISKRSSAQRILATTLHTIDEGRYLDNFLAYLGWLDRLGALLIRSKKLPKVSKAEDYPDAIIASQVNQVFELYAVARRAVHYVDR